MILRSLLFVPGHNEKLITSAAKSEADAIILDLEDSVPERDKSLARGTVRRALAVLFPKPVFVRINGRDTSHFWPDIDEVMSQSHVGIVYPKVTSADELLLLGTLPGVSLIPLIETAAAVLNCQSICEVPSVIAVAFGCEDFIADLQGIHSHESLLTPRAMIALAARAAGKIPIDTVHINVHDLEDLKRETTLSRSLGFEGMLTLHPKELPIIHAAYTPSELEVASAREMLQLSQQAATEGKGVAVMNGRFIGPPLVRQAQSIISRYERIKSCHKE